MINGTNLLNQVQKMLITFANDNNISLHDEFGTVEKFKQFVVAFTIKSLMDIGCEINKAYDIVFGDGSYNELAERVWEAAR